MLNALRELAYRGYKRLEIREHRLEYLFLEITRRCNLNCLHCGSDCTKEQQSGELTTESWLKIISYVRERFGPQVVFVITGGEPLLHPELDRIGAHVTSLGMRWGMVTNGMALTGARLARLREAGLYSLTISLDGQADAHNELRNHPRAFEKVDAALDALGRAGPPMVDAVTCVYPGNLHELDAIAEHLIARRIPAWRLFRIFPLGRAAQNDRLLMTHAQTWQMLDWIADRRPAYAARGLSVSASCEGYVPYAVDRKIRELPFFCRAGINMGSILSDGAITGCTNNHPSFHQGNILEDDLATVWAERFESYRDRAWVAETRCGPCPERAKCEGGSIHLWERHGEAPAFCYLEKRLG